jgi:SAM-dependent methyltransferase
MVIHCCGLLGQRLEPSENLSGLAVGCGNGDEVVYMRRMFHSPKVIGLDREIRFSQAASAEHCVLVADAEGLPFPSGTFDFVAAFHSLEHVRNPRPALEEIWRVLRPGGWLYVGVPNKSRIVGYVGAFDTTTCHKVVWNLKDWASRLRGKFENESGAHAGFRQAELLSLLGERFADVRLLTEEFIRFKYRGRLPKPLLDLLLARGIINLSAPSHYALCQRPG